MVIFGSITPPPSQKNGLGTRDPSNDRSKRPTTTSTNPKSPQTLRAVDAVTFKMPLQHYNQIVKEHRQPQAATGQTMKYTNRLNAVKTRARLGEKFPIAGWNATSPHVRSPSPTNPLYPPAQRRQPCPKSLDRPFPLLGRVR
jgi:hypothetical protein